ncbi:MAG: methylglutaconyl-CoA hydratase [Moritella sp.]|jgi:methylglutaconyl-CoA hydratase
MTSSDGNGNTPKNSNVADNSNTPNNANSSSEHNLSNAYITKNSTGNIVTKSTENNYHNIPAYLLTSIDSQGIATVTLNRTQVHNAFDDVMISQLLTTFTTLKEDPRVRALILRSRGKHFSAGADLNWMQEIAQQTYQQNLADAGLLAQLMSALNLFPRPTIALVHGAAFGSAVGLIACCDIALATTQACFCLSEVKIGLIPAVISPYVVAAIGQRQARRYCLTGEKFNAQQALTYGLVHQLCDDLDQGVKPYIHAILANSPAATQAAKALIQDVTNQPINPPLIADTSQRIAAIRVSSEGQEGLSALLQKRKPHWAKE